MIYWHGSKSYFKYFDINRSREYMDFGRGIYLSESMEHAKSVARIGNTPGYLYEYKVNLRELRQKYRIREFRTPTVDWVKLILEERTGKIKQNEYDIIIGPTADAAAQRIISEFIRFFGMSATQRDYERLIEMLKTIVYATQICLKTQDVISEFNRSRIYEGRV